MIHRSSVVKVLSGYIARPFHIPFTSPCYTDIEPRKEIYVIFATCLVVYHQEKTQNADFAGDFAVYVDDYAEWICHHYEIGRAHV